MKLKSNSLPFYGMASLVCAVVFSLFCVSAHAQSDWPSAPTSYTNSHFTVVARTASGGCMSFCNPNVGPITFPVVISNTVSGSGAITVNLSTVYALPDYYSFVGVHYSSTQVSVLYGHPVTVYMTLTDLTNNLTDEFGYTQIFATEQGTSNYATANVKVFVGP